MKNRVIAGVLALALLMPTARAWSSTSGADGTGGATSFAGLTGVCQVGQGGTGSTSASDARTALGAAASGANSDITSLGGLSTPIAVGGGGTGSATASGARSNLGAAASGANSDITSLSALSTALSVGQGGTGSTTASGARSNLGAAASGANTDITSFTLTPQAAPSAPASGWTQYTDSSDGHVKIKKSDGTVVDLSSPSGGSGTTLTAGTYGDRVIQIGPSTVGSATVSVAGIAGAATASGITGAAITGKRLTFPATTGTASGDLAYYGHNGSGSNDVTAFALEPAFSTIVYVTDTTNVRIWTGLTSTAGGGFWATDTPGSTDGEHGMMFRFSTSAGDTNWQGVTYNGTSQTVSDTGIAVTASHLYRLEMTTASGGGSIDFKVTDITAGTNATVTISATLPGSSTNIKPMSLVATLTTATKTENFGTLWVSD